MHLVFGMTGVINEVDALEAYLKTMSVPLPYKDENGIDKIQWINAQLRPIRFYDYVFPRDQLHQVLNTIKPETEIQSKNASVSNLYFAAIRKALKLTKIPAPDLSKGQWAFPLQHNVRIVGIGIREDADLTFGTGKIQEGI